MKRNHKTMAGLAAAGFLLIAAAAHAHPGDMDGKGMMNGGMGHGMMGGGMMGHTMGPGAGMTPGAMGQGPAGRGGMESLMTPEERTALREKMRNAKTPEERRQLAAATHAEMEKRAREKGVTLPDGPGAGIGAHRH